MDLKKLFLYLVVFRFYLRFKIKLDLCAHPIIQVDSTGVILKIREVLTRNIGIKSSQFFLTCFELHLVKR